MALLVSFHLYICASQIDICADEQIWPEFYLTVTGLVLPTNLGYRCILLVLNRLILAAVLLTPETSAIKFSWSILVKLVLQLKCLLVQTHNSKCDISTDSTSILYIVYSSTLSLSHCLLLQVCKFGRPLNINLLPFSQSFQSFFKTKIVINFSCLKRGLVEFVGGAVELLNPLSSPLEDRWPMISITIRVSIYFQSDGTFGLARYHHEFKEKSLRCLFAPL